jgi:hypothetical protein
MKETHLCNAMPDGIVNCPLRHFPAMNMGNRNLCIHGRNTDCHRLIAVAQNNKQILPVFSKKKPEPHKSLRHRFGHSD